MYWRLVEHGLPKKDKEQVLIKTENGVRCGIFNLEDKTFDRLVEEVGFGGDMNGSFYYKWDNSVTAWLPLSDIITD